MTKLVLRRPYDFLDNPNDYNEVFSLQSRINNLFSNFLGSPYESLQVNEPKIDLAETNEGYEIKAELPGMSEKDVDLSYNDGILTIKGEKKAEKEEKQKNYYYKECSYGSFSRSISLPDIAENKIDASFANGILDIKLPKSQEDKSKIKKIEIKKK